MDTIDVKKIREQAAQQPTEAKAFVTGDTVKVEPKKENKEKETNDSPK